MSKELLIPGEFYIVQQCASKISIFFDDEERSFPITGRYLCEGDMIFITNVKPTKWSSSSKATSALHNLRRHSKVFFFILAKNNFESNKQFVILSNSFAGFMNEDIPQYFKLLTDKAQVPQNQTFDVDDG